MHFVLTVDNNLSVNEKNLVLLVPNLLFLQTLIVKLMSTFNCFMYYVGFTIPYSFSNKHDVILPLQQICFVNYTATLQK